MSRFRWRWLLYAVLIAAPALIAWEDLFYVVTFDETRDSILRQGSTSSYLIFGAALVLPLLYVAAARLRVFYGPRSRPARAINLFYLFAALGYILDAITFAAFHDGTGDTILYFWAIFLMVIYLPITTVAAVVLTTPAAISRPRTEDALS